jgi:formate-dependent phosphoribosylglycinamide formyltransferase (GAR transformylase)
MRTLLLGASFSAVPIYNRLILAGHEVTVVGSLRDDPCHKITNNSIFVDYSELDDVREIWAKGTFDFLVPTCNDASIKTATALASEYPILGYDNMNSFSQIANKDQFRWLCQKLELHAPRILAQFVSESKVENFELQGKALVKPVDSFSGIGISFVENSVTDHQIKNALSASKVGKAVIEEFVEGTLHSHSAFIKDGLIQWQEFVDEYCDVNPYQVNRSYYPSRLGETIKIKVSAEIHKVAKYLNLSDGLIHTQFISNEDDFWLIEAMRRCPGDLFGTHFKLSSDFDYTWNYIAPFIGEEFDFSQKDDARAVSRQVLTLAASANFYGVRASASASEAETLFVPLLSSGDMLNAAPHGKAGIVFQATKNVPQDANYTIIESTTF